MHNEKKRPRRSVLLSYRFLGTAVLGSIIMALVSVFGPLPSQLAILGAFISILGGLFLSYLSQDEQREQQRNEAIQSLSVPLLLAGNPELFEQYQDICRSMTALAEKNDAILHRIAMLKFASVAEQLQRLADGKVVFSLTEEWRTVYEQLLQSPDVRE